jgi:hypothetical protein
MNLAAILQTLASLLVFGGIAGLEVLYVRSRLRNPSLSRVRVVRDAGRMLLLLGFVGGAVLVGLRIAIHALVG